MTVAPDLSQTARYLMPAPATFPRTARPQVAWDDPRTTCSIPQACTTAGVSRRTIYNWLRKGRVDWRRTASGSVRIVVETLWEDQARDQVAQPVHAETYR